MLVAAIACVALALRDDEPAAATAPDSRVAHTPLLSARRAPFVFDEPLARVRLEQELTAFVTQQRACVAVADPATPDAPLVRVNADVPLAPASTMKLLTGAAALSVLGPEHTFTTDARLGDDGTLYFVGGGDPVLTTPIYERQLRAAPDTATDVVTPLAPLADAIAANGFSSIPRIVADDSRQDDVRFLADWKPGYTADVGALGALTVNDGYAGPTRADNPALNAAEQLRILLTERGVAVGDIGEGIAPADANEVASVSSPPLADIVASMLTSSDNLTAELLAREVGIAAGGDGSTPAGTRAVEAALTNAGVPTTGLDLRDGSGLAVDNRVTCDAVLAALELASGPRFEALDRGLAVAGSTGTLAGRLRGDPLQGVLRAKTAHIDDVTGLAGVVDDAEHLRFAFVANDDFTAPGGRALGDQVARLVAAYPEPPPAGASPVPAPATTT
jgi:D-alanyl-D-alanine carboxypeptidase/D-alanyl-D-alanine-endopeptidase (penicillin-binding protein 4)